MPPATPYARVAITLPKRDLAAADRLARTLDRSRSWVIAEAIRRFSVSPTAAPHPAPEPDRRVRPGLGPSREAQLDADLALTPEERVRAAEETLRTTEAIRRRPPEQSLRVFDDYRAYVDFKRRQID